MITLHTWQLIAVLVIAFLFGWGIGRTMGESRAWAKMDRQEEAQQTPELFHPIERIIGNRIYRTEGSTILAVKIFQQEYERDEDYLMKTVNGSYFMQSHQGFKGGSRYDHVYPYTKEVAMRSFNGMEDQRVTFEEAFGEKLLEA